MPTCRPGSDGEAMARADREYLQSVETTYAKLESVFGRTWHGRLLWRVARWAARARRPSNVRPW